MSPLSIGSHTTQPELRALPADRMRALLRRLRDLNLRAGAVAVSGGRTVRIEGCVSVDGPVESALRYRLCADVGGTALLEIAGEPGNLRLLLSDLAGTAVQRARLVPIYADARQRATAPSIAARMDLECADARAAEHFLRRVVRAIFAPAAALAPAVR